MSTLTKDFIPVYVPEKSETVTECFTHPGTPGLPAYCTTQQVQQATSVWTCVARNAQGVIVAQETYAGIGLANPVGTFTSEYTVPPGGTAVCEVVGYVTGNVTVEVCYPEIEPVAPWTECTTRTVVTPAHYEDRYNRGWNAGAISIPVVRNDARFTVVAPHHTVSTITGFGWPGNNRTVFQPYSIYKGFQFSNGKFRVLENTTQRTAFTAYTASDEFHIERIGTTYNYYRNNTLVYTTTGLEGALWAKSTFYVSDDVLTDAALVGFVAAIGQPQFGLVGETNDRGAALSFAAPEFGAEGSANDQGAALTFGQPQFGVQATGIGGGAVANGQPQFGVQGHASDGFYAVGIPEFGVEGEAGASPVVAIEPQGVTGYLGFNITALAIENPVANGQPQFGMVGRAADEQYVFGVPQFGVRGLALAFSAEITPIPPFAGEVSLPLPRVEGTLNDGQMLSGEISIPLPAIAGEQGLVGEISIPLPSVAGEFLPGGFFGAVSIPLPSVDGLLLGGDDIQGRVSIPLPSIEAYDGLGGKVSIPVPSVVGTLIPGNVLSGQVSIPLPSVSGAAVAPDSVLIGSISLPLPGSFGVVGALTGAVSIPLPAVSGAFSVTIGDDGYAYAINLQTGAVARWTGYPAVERIVRYQGRAFALVAGELIELRGNLDDDAAITATLKTHPFDFGDARLKRPVAVRMGVRESDGATARLIADENLRTAAYTIAANSRGEGGHNTRIKAGKGLRKYRYLAVEVANQEGGTLDIDSLELEQIITDRRL